MSNVAHNARTLALGAVCLTLASTALALVDPKTGGKDGGQLNVLFILGPTGAGEAKIDEGLAKRLADRGYAAQVVSDVEPLTAEYLRQFNTVVWAGLADFNGGGYYTPNGVKLMNTATNVKLIHQYVADGGGLVVMPLMCQAGTEVSANYKEALAPWKMEIGWETVRDEANAATDPSVMMGKEGVYFWTKNITAGPLTEGVKALLYPGICMRWDDAYSCNPLMPKDPAWQVLVRGEKTAAGVRQGDQRKWLPGDSGEALVLAAAREAGKGRVAVIGIGAYYTAFYPFNEKMTNAGESTTGPLAGIPWEKGDGKTPSDWGKLIDNLLRWTGEPSAKAGMGGKCQPWQTKLAKVEIPADQVPSFAVVDWKTQKLPGTWTFHSPNVTWWQGTAFYDEIPDPLVVKPQQMNKILIGAHSANSDGKGSIAEWAAAAKAAGYKAVVFTERFDKLKGENWAKIIAECEANSSPDFACLQGMDIPDGYGNRFLILGNNNFPPSGVLTEDGKALLQTARLSLGFSGHIAVIHRPAGNAKNGLPTELCRHFQALSVYTYGDDGKGGYGLVDDGMKAYEWQLWNASNPVPMVVHELFSPADVAKKATVGFQQIVPAQDAQDAVRYFRFGLDHFFENPQRYFITDGPMIDGFAIFNKDIGRADCNRDHWRAVIGASAGEEGATIKEAVLYDRGQVASRWTPNKASFSEIIDGEHGEQKHFMLVVTDSKGRKAISPHLRTVPRGYFTRCGDRQNWFGAAGSYTGIWPSGTHGIYYVSPLLPMPNKADTEVFGGDYPMASKMSLPFASNALNFTDFTVDCHYVRKGVQYGMDAWRIENVEPSKTYECVARVGKWHDIALPKPAKADAYTNAIATLTWVRATLKSKVAVTPATPVWPIINTVPGAAAYCVWKDGKMVDGKLDGKPETVIDLPAGARIGDQLLLAPLAVSGNGQLGWRVEAGKEIPAGTEWKAAYAYAPAEWMAGLGAGGPTPWSMQLTQGKLDSVLGVVNITAANYGVSGTIKGGGEPNMLPLKISGLNPRWPAAMWTPDNAAYSLWSGLVQVKPIKGTNSGAVLAHIGVLDDIGYAALGNKDQAFFVGNTLTATDSALELAWSYWTDKEAGIEVNNPTDKPIKAKIASPKAIVGKLAVDTEVEVPAGSTVRLTLPAK